MSDGVAMFVLQFEVHLSQRPTQRIDDRPGHLLSGGETGRYKARSQQAR